MSNIDYAKKANLQKTMQKIREDLGSAPYPKVIMTERMNEHVPHAVINCGEDKCRETVSKVLNHPWLITFLKENNASARIQQNYDTVSRITIYFFH